jgi:hypothetical protein
MFRRPKRLNKNVELLQKSWWALPEQREALRPYIDRATEYRKECGCTMGGVFSLVSVMVVASQYIFFPGYTSGSWMRVLLYRIGFVLTASIAGKALGIGLARIRLRFLYRQVHRQLRSNGA